MDYKKGVDYLTIEDLRKEEPSTLRYAESAQGMLNQWVEVYRERWLHAAGGRVSEYVGFTDRGTWEEWMRKIGTYEFYIPTIPDSEPE